MEQHGTFDHLLGALKAQGDAAGHFLDKLKRRRRQVSPRSAVGRKRVGDEALVKTFATLPHKTELS